MSGEVKKCRAPTRSARRSAERVADRRDRAEHIAAEPAAQREEHHRRRRRTRGRSCRVAARAPAAATRSRRSPPSPRETSSSPLRARRGGGDPRIIGRPQRTRPAASASQSSIPQVIAGEGLLQLQRANSASPASYQSDPSDRAQICDHTDHLPGRMCSRP